MDGAPAGYATPPVWDVRTLPTSHGQVLPAAPIAGANFKEEVANKAAEIAVLRNRLKEFERENLKMKNEVAMAKDKGAQSDRVRQMGGEVDRLQNELRYAKQDLISSEDERKRLKTSCQDAQSELKSARKAVPAALPLCQTMPPPVGACAAESSPLPSRQARLPFTPQTAQRGHPVASLGTPQASPSAALSQVSPAPPLPSPARAQSKQWRQDVLLRELSCWEAASKAVGSSQGGRESVEPSASWFVLRETVGRVTTVDLCEPISKAKAMAGNRDLAVAVTRQLRSACRAKHWVVVQGGARFVQVLIGLFPDMVSILKPQTVGGSAQDHAVSAEPPSGIALFDELTAALHVVVLGSREVAASGAHTNNTGDCQACAAQLLKTLLEIVGKLRPHRHELDALGSAFQRPSLCALLVEVPSSGSLHLPCLQLLQALLASTELFALAHRGAGHENLLLAVANLLVIPTTGDNPHGGHDSPELQECRVAALQVFCRCLASAPSLDMVLRLRGDPTVDGETFETVLQLVVFLCHHELLCLGIQGVDGGSWHDQSLQECAKRRQRAIELSLMILSSFVWHATSDMHAPNHSTACSEACEALGRMRPLVASIVDMVVRRAAHSPYYTCLLGSASALRVLLAPADGQDCCSASRDGGAVGKAGDGSAVMMVVDD